ncbi:hypothetical protein B0T16DRAFT_366990 [Cercophora newfieldiana]|uniref:SnoaL-like domain-containing protein n=1 Tax=Cercophora newfieldiana TaxID=92897 RepID=A0AA39YHB8_9PEZI|nr:hypothetical protein B0T16DRAFT_366990 [Cercophora newfieldiana]
MASDSQLTLHQTMSQTLSKFLNAFLEVSAANDTTLFSTTLDPGCLRFLRPTSLLTKMGAPTDLAMDVTTYEKILEKEMHVFKTISGDFSDVSIDTTAKTGAATAVYVNRLVDGQEFKLEFSWHVAFAEDGAKITKVVQWCDAIGMLEFQAAIAAVANSGGSE